MTIGQKIKDLVKQSGMTAEEVAASLGVSVSSLFKYYKKENFNTSLLEQIAPIFNVEVSYFFTNNEKNKTALGNHSIAGSDNLINGSYYVTPPPEGYIKIISPDGEIQEVEMGSLGYKEKQTITELTKQLEEKKSELIQLQSLIIKLQDYIIESKG